MPRREIVVLISRALACIQLMSALLDATYLPDRILAFLHYANLPEPISDSQHFFKMQDELGVLTLVLRIGILLTAFLIFWNCGPWIERTLFPPRIGTESRTDPSAD